MMTACREAIRTITNYRERFTTSGQRVLEDEELGPEGMSRHLDGETAQFVRRRNALFPVARSVVVVEVMSVDGCAPSQIVVGPFLQFVMSHTLKNVFPRWSKNAMRRSRFRSRKWVLRTRPALLPNVE